MPQKSQKNDQANEWFLNEVPFFGKFYNINDSTLSVSSTRLASTAYICDHFWRINLKFLF